MSTQIEALTRKGGAPLNWLMRASSLATIAWVSFRTIGDDPRSHHCLRSCGEAQKSCRSRRHPKSHDSLVGVGPDAALAGRLGNGEFTATGSREARRHATVAPNSVSRLDAMDDVEHFGADAEDRYSHVPERHAVGCPANSSGSGKSLDELQLTDPVGAHGLAGGTMSAQWLLVGPAEITS